MSHSPCSTESSLDSSMLDSPMLDLPMLDSPDRTCPSDLLESLPDPWPNTLLPEPGGQQPEALGAPVPYPAPVVPNVDPGGLPNVVGAPALNKEGDTVPTVDVYENIIQTRWFRCYRSLFTLQSRIL